MSIKKELIIQDPVCGTIIKKEEAVTLTLENNKKIYFCSRKCMVSLLKFRRDPKKLKWTKKYKSNTLAKRI